jgi:hypothetical protein
MQGEPMSGPREIEWTPAPVAMLWDMDNVTTGRQEIAGLARLLGGLGSPEVRRIAAGHHVTCRTNGGVASEMGFEVVSGGRRRQGADRQLLRHASRQAERGARYFWVVSNDGAFSRVAGLGYVTVLTLDETRVSERLRAAAIAVIALKREAGQWRIRYAGSVPYTNSTRAERDDTSFSGPQHWHVHSVIGQKPPH